VKRFVPRVGAKMSNGAPMPLRLRLIGDYVLGLYNPRNH
jgi:hypothetical protein